MNSKHINIIQALIERDSFDIELSLDEIYEKSATVVFEHLAKNWDSLKDEVKLEIAFLNAGKENVIEFLALMEGLNQEYKSLNLH